MKYIIQRVGGLDYVSSVIPIVTYTNDIKRARIYDSDCGHSGLEAAADAGVEFDFIEHVPAFCEVQIIITDAKGNKSFESSEQVPPGMSNHLSRIRIEYRTHRTEWYSGREFRTRSVKATRDTEDASG